MLRRLTIGVCVVLLMPLAAAQAAGETLGAVVVDGPLRAGAFTQVFHASASGLNAATMTAVVEQQSGPGSMTSSDARISSATQVVGQLSATVSGGYAMNLCIAPKATPTCAAATAVKTFSVTVAGLPTSMTIEPAVQSAAAGTAVPFVIKVLDASARTTLLAVGESVAVATSAGAGVVTVDGVNTPSTGLNARLRTAGLGSFTVANDSAGTSTEITASAVGFSADDVVGYLATDPPPQDIQLVLDEPVSATTLGASVEITGSVLDAEGDPIAGATVAGTIDGVDSGSTSTDTTAADGLFRVTFTSSSAVSGQHDDVDLTASEPSHGSDQSRAVVYFTGNGRTPISDVAIDGIPIADYTDSIDVPTTGIAGTEAGSATLITFTSAVPGATVDVSASQGVLTRTDDVAWAEGSSALQIVTDATGLGRAYLHSTRTGTARVEVVAARRSSGVVRIETPARAARDVSVTASAGRVSAGNRVLLTVVVVDAFANPVADARVDLALRSDSAGHFSNADRQVSVRTDADGNAVVEVATGPKERGAIRLVARGDVPECADRNQYACPVNEPGAGFAAARGADPLVIDIVPRVVRVTAPVFDTPVSTNQLIIVKASTRGIARGTVALLKTGHREVARAAIGAQGILVFPAIRASGDGVYAIAVGGFSTRVQVSIRTFGITRVHRASTNAFTVATGAWRKGTAIVLLCDGKVVTSARLMRAHQALVIRAANRPGTYQVQVQTPQGIVRGAKAWVIR